jgi:ssDNA-binding Zn-finger/Zn-ribbon topoisomerase 1
MLKKYNEKEVECPKCHKKVKPLLKLNRLKSEFIGSKYTGKDKLYWQICPNCKFVITTK